MKKHNKIVAIQGDPIPSINKKTDTTLLLALEAQRRGYKIYYYETKNLAFLNNKVYALCQEIEFNENKKKFYSIKNTIMTDLSKTSFILMRQNPPFNMDYITATFLLEKISKNTQIINNPFAVRNMPEKLYSIEFLKMMPPTIFTKNVEIIENFKKKYKKIVVKPTHGYGGKNIFFVNKETKKKQIVFAGIDLISNYLTGDINITSPTGLKNYKDLTGIDLAFDFWNYLEKKK